MRKQRVGGSQQVSAKPIDVPREPAAAVLKPNAAGEGTAGWCGSAAGLLVRAAVEKQLLH